MTLATTTRDSEAELGEIVDRPRVPVDTARTCESEILAEAPPGDGAGEAARAAA